MQVVRQTAKARTCSENVCAPASHFETRVAAIANCDTVRR
jgi:hypothetical protein